MFKNRISTKEGKKNLPEKRLGERGGKSVRTSFHGRHFPDLPGGEITIEVTSTVKHCTTAIKKSRIKMGLRGKKGDIVQK